MNTENQKYFQETQISFPKCINIKNFGNSVTIIGGFGVSLNFQSLTSRKQYAQKMSGCGTECLDLVAVVIYVI